MPRSWLGTANAVLVSRTVTFPYSHAIWTSLFLFQSSVVSRTDVRGIIHKQISFLWLVVNDVSSSYGSSFIPLGWRWDPSGDAAFAHLHSRTGMRYRAQQEIWLDISSFPCTRCLAQFFFRSCHGLQLLNIIFRLVFPLGIVMFFWLCHHSYFCYQIAKKHCKNLRKIPEAFNNLLTMISDK